MTMRFCPQCGAEHPSATPFCAVCGARRFEETTVEQRPVGDSSGNGNGAALLAAPSRAADTTVAPPRVTAAPEVSDQPTHPAPESPSVAPAATGAAARVSTAGLTAIATATAAIVVLVARLGGIW